MKESKVYIRTGMDGIRNRGTKNLSTEMNTKVQNILNNFRTFFIDKHSS